MTTTVSNLLSHYVNDPKHGPLPAILLLLTAGTGVVDAISILGLGRVFVANMTGNIVFIGFALAGAPGFSLWGSIVALVAFLLGASLGGVAVARFSSHRGRLLRNALAIQLGFFLVALALTAVVTTDDGQLVFLALASAALGIQNSVVRHLAVPDMTTSVLTMTLTGIGSEIGKHDYATMIRRIAAVLSMLIGALIGALIVTHFGVTAGLVAVVVVTVIALVVTFVSSRGEPDWAMTST